MTSASEFETFYRETHPRLWSYLARTTQGASLADDLTQEAFVRLLASRGADLPVDQRRAYLFRIAENLVLDAWRKTARERTTSLEDAPEPLTETSGGAAGLDAAAAFATLSDRDRKLLWLAHVEGWRHAEIAELLGLAAGSIRVLLHRARGRLQERLEKGGNR